MQEHTDTTIIVTRACLAALFDTLLEQDASTGARWPAAGAYGSIGAGIVKSAAGVPAFLQASNAMAATAIAREMFEARGIGADQLPKAVVEYLPLDQKTEADRAARVEEGTGPASPGLVRDTAEVLFRDLWLRPDLAPRDRSLITVSALIAAGQVEQIPYHLNRAMDNGLTRAEASEVISHLAYYAGWPKAFSAAPIARTVFEKRSGN